MFIKYSLYLSLFSCSGSVYVYFTERESEQDRNTEYTPLMTATTISLKQKSAKYNGMFAVADRMYTMMNFCEVSSISQQKYRFHAMVDVKIRL